VFCHVTRFIHLTQLIHLSAYTYTYMYMHMYMYVYMYTYTHTYMHMHGLRIRIRTHSPKVKTCVLLFTWCLLYVCYHLFMCMTRLIHTSNTIDLYVRHASFTYTILPIHMRDESFKCAIWIVYMCDITRPFLCRGSFICVTWLIRICDKLVYVCDMTHSNVWHGSFLCATWLIHM